MRCLDACEGGHPMALLVEPPVLDGREPFPLVPDLHEFSTLHMLGSGGDH